MYLESIHIRNLKLLRDLELDFRQDEDHELARHGLEMPPFPDDNPAPAPPPVRLDTRENRPSWITGRALLFVRYVEKEQVTSQALQEVIIERCRLRPLTKQELAEHLHRSTGTVEKRLRTLVSEKKLNGTGKPRLLSLR